jgi:hypothetical protein
VVVTINNTDHHDLTKVLLIVQNTPL